MDEDDSVERFLDRFWEDLENGTEWPDLEEFIAKQDHTLSSEQVALFKREALRLKRGHETCERYDLARVLDADGRLSSGDQVNVTTTYVVSDGKSFRGSMGEVLTAKDLKAKREVAIKVALYRSVSAGHLLQEAEITSRLQHPSIPPVYGIGFDAKKRPFFVMRFVGGRTLFDAIRGLHATHRVTTTATEAACGLFARTASRMSKWIRSWFHVDSPGTVTEFQKLLRQFVAVCDAAAFAHSRGVVHLDIKPDNIKIGEFGEVVLLDWGLAAEFNPPGGGRQSIQPFIDGIASDDIRIRRVSGTPGYRSPEQFCGGRLGPASDIYSLGAVLYAILVGERPPDVAAADKYVRMCESLHQKGVPWTLRGVCAKALAPQPVDRYSDAKGLAYDIDLWIAGELVEVPFVVSPGVARVLQVAGLAAEVFNRSGLLLNRVRLAQALRIRAQEQGPLSSLPYAFSAWLALLMALFRQNWLGQSPKALAGTIAILLFVSFVLTTVLVDIPESFLGVSVNFYWAVALLLFLRWSQDTTGQWTPTTPRF